jgi:hypothetical protein
MPLSKQMYPRQQKAGWAPKTELLTTWEWRDAEHKKTFTLPAWLAACLEMAGFCLRPELVQADLAAGS